MRTHDSSWKRFWLYQSAHSSAINWSWSWLNMNKLAARRKCVKAHFFEEFDAGSCGGDDFKTCSARSLKPAKRNGPYFAPANHKKVPDDVQKETWGLEKTIIILWSLLRFEPINKPTKWIFSHRVKCVIIFWKYLIDNNVALHSP